MDDNNESATDCIHITPRPTWQTVEAGPLLRQTDSHVPETHPPTWSLNNYTDVETGATGLKKIGEFANEI